MCRPPCCNQGGDQKTGIAAVALIMLAALIAAKAGPIVARVIGIVLEVIRLVALTTGLVVVLAAVTWAAITITRWQLRRKTLAANATPMVAAFTIRVPSSQPAHSADCLACGGTGTVLQAIGSGRYQPGECPVCEPIMRAG
jgi:hypothetical protein